MYFIYEYLYTVDMSIEPTLYKCLVIRFKDDLYSTL